MAQRLARVICPQCKQPHQPPEETISLCNPGENISASNGRFYKGAGCENCLETGYLGRTGIFELLVIDDDIKELIAGRSGSHVIEQAAIQKGMSTLRQDGLSKAMAGETTLQEVCRVTQDSVQTTVEVSGRAGS
jgi:general secretion pathway protein E